MLTRITANAILTHGSKVLLLKRGLHKELAPGLWAGIGGHIDNSDVENFRAINLIETCYREVREEAGIGRADIHGLKLRYIAVRKTDTEIRWHHHYLGELETEIIPPHCEEGELHWVSKTDIPTLPMTASVKEPLKHWLANPNCEDTVLFIVDGERATASVCL